MIYSQPLRLKGLLLIILVIKEKGSTVLKASDYMLIYMGLKKIKSF